MSGALISISTGMFVSVFLGRTVFFGGGDSACPKCRWHHSLGWDLGQTRKQAFSFLSFIIHRAAVSHCCREELVLSPCFPSHDGLSPSLWARINTSCLKFIFAGYLVTETSKVTNTVGVARWPTPLLFVYLEHSCRPCKNSTCSCPVNLGKISKLVSVHCFRGSPSIDQIGHRNKKILMFPILDKSQILCI